METFNIGKKADSVQRVCNKYGIKDLTEARQICDNNGVDVEQIVKGVQPICFDDAVYAYELGTTDLWYKYAAHPFGINTFGYSGKFNEILDYIGFTAEKLAEQIK